MEIEVFTEEATVIQVQAVLEEEEMTDEMTEEEIQDTEIDIQVLEETIEEALDTIGTKGIVGFN
jgi:hypothetical protein